MCLDKRIKFLKQKIYDQCNLKHLNSTKIWNPLRQSRFSSEFMWLSTHTNLFRQQQYFLFSSIRFYVTRMIFHLKCSLYLFILLLLYMYVKIYKKKSYQFKMILFIPREKSLMKNHCKRTDLYYQNYYDYTLFHTVFACLFYDLLNHIYAMR